MVEEHWRWNENEGERQECLVTFVIHSTEDCCWLQIMVGYRRGHPNRTCCHLYLDHLYHEMMLSSRSSTHPHVMMSMNHHLHHCHYHWHSLMRPSSFGYSHLSMSPSLISDSRNLIHSQPGCPQLLLHACCSLKISPNQTHVSMRKRRMRKTWPRH